LLSHLFWPAISHFPPTNNHQPNQHSVTDNQQPSATNQHSVTDKPTTTNHQPPTIYHQSNAIVYEGPLAVFVAQVSLTEFARDIGEQIVVAGTAHLAGSGAVQVLAGFGLAFHLTKRFGGLLQEMRPVGLMLCGSKAERNHSLVSIAAIYTVIFTILLALARGEVGLWLVLRVHRTGPTVGAVVRDALALLCLWPLCDGLALLHAGILLRHHHAGWVSAASVCDIVAQVATAAVFLGSSQGGSGEGGGGDPSYASGRGALTGNPLKLPACCVYAGVLARMSVCWGGYLLRVAPSLPNQPPLKAPDPSCTSRTVPLKPVVGTWAGGALVAAGSHQPPAAACVARSQAGPAAAASALASTRSGVMAVLRFAYPLALSNLAANATRPLINLAVARSADGTDGVAILTACYPLVHLVYGWLNQLKSVVPSFCT
jgi:hypothetical protein